MQLNEQQRAALRAYLAGLAATLSEGARMSPKKYRRLMHEWRRVRDYLAAADQLLKSTRRRPC